MPFITRNEWMPPGNFHTGIVHQWRFMYTKDQQIDLLYSLVKEIEKRLEDGDWESPLSMCKSIDIVLKHGIDSAEWKTYYAIESARLS